MALTDNLNLYWKCDEASGDLSDSVNAHTGTVSATGVSSAMINNGVTFGAAALKCKVETPDATDIRFGTLSAGNSGSLSLWYKPTNTTGVQTLISKWSNNTAGTQANDYIIYQSGTTVTYGVAGSVTGQKTQAVAAGNWYHIVLTATSAGFCTLYKNAAAVSGTLTSLKSQTSFDPVRLGQNTVTNFYTGVIDEVGIWRRVLTAQEVTDLYNSGNGIQYPFGGGAAPIFHNLAALGCGG